VSDVRLWTGSRMIEVFAGALKILVLITNAVTLEQRALVHNLAATLIIRPKSL